MKIVDMHCDTIMRMALSDGKIALRENDGHIDIAKLQKGGCLAQFFAIFIPMMKMKEIYGEDSSYKYFNKAYEVYLSEMEKNKDFILPARNYDEIIEQWRIITKAKEERCPPSLQSKKATLFRARWKE